MAPLDEYFTAFIDALVLNPTWSRGEAVDFLQTETNGVSNAEGNAWYDAIVALFESLNIINNANWNNYRAQILDDADAAKLLHANLRLSIVGLPESDFVVPNIRVFDLERRRDRINDRIQWAIQYRDASGTVPHPFPPTNQGEFRDLENTLTRGIQSLRDEREQLDNQIAGRA